MSEMSKEALDLISEHPWDETISRLVLYARGRMRRLFWQGIFGGPAPEGKEAEDLVMDSITKVLDGIRVWDPVKDPDLFFFMRSVVKREINLVAESWENTHFFREAVLSGKKWENSESPGFWNSVTCPNPTPESAILSQELEQLSDRFFWAFHEFLSESPMLQKMLECIMDGCLKRAEIAEKMGIPVKEFDNLKKQIQRRLKSFQEQDQGSGG